MRHYIISALVWLAMLGGCAMQQDIDPLYIRMASLEERYADLERRNAALEKRGANIASQMDAADRDRQETDQTVRYKSAETRVMLEKLREEIRHLNGKVEESEYLLRQKSRLLENLNRTVEERFQRVEETVSDSRQRISHVERYLSMEIAPAEQAPEESAASAAGPEVAGKLSDLEIYQAAKQAFDEGDFESARKGFQNLLKRYPKSKQADNAQFWIGEIFYREKWYEKAILEYQKVIEKYPRGNKVAAALLKQGLAFHHLGDRANARLILRQLLKKYPGANEAKIAERKLKEIK